MKTRKPLAFDDEDDVAAAIARLRAEDEFLAGTVEDVIAAAAAANEKERE